MMNKKAFELNLLGVALLFVVLFFVGGIIGVLFLPEFTGRFYISGLIFGAFGTGAGKLILNLGGK